MTDQVKPGRELDIEVARVLGFRGIEKAPEGTVFDFWGYAPKHTHGWRSQIPHYSTANNKAMETFEWLQQNHPWKRYDRYKAFVFLGEYEGKPSVVVFQEDLDSLVTEGPLNYCNFYIAGETYAHAIALAVVEAGKVRDANKT